MQHTRRDVLGLAGLSLSALAAGCLGRPGGTGTRTATPTDRTATATPTSALPAELSRVDEPPYEIDHVECGADSERDPRYLCANMPTEPTLSFEQAASRGNVLADSGLALSEEDAGREMYVTLLSDADRLDATDTSDPAQLVRETDFDSHAVLVVQTGWGSGSVYPSVGRIETTATGVHAFGCHTAPCAQTMDFTMRTAAVRFERVDTLDSAVVSLTVAPDERWNAAAGEGIVTLPDN